MDNTQIALKNIKKVELINDLNRMRNEATGLRLLAILDFLVEEIREQNDYISPDQLLFNQGKINAFLSLKRFVEEGIPTINQKFS
jgi:hypothetical protein